MHASGRTVRKRFSPSLAKGQLWKTDRAYIQIVELGKKLIDYRMMRELGQRRRTQTTTYEEMEAYLKTNEGRLARGDSRNEVLASPFLRLHGSPGLGRSDPVDLTQWLG
jgi:hypothetical protein